MKYERFFYYQDENYATALIIDHTNRIAYKYLNCNPIDCASYSSMILITVETANTLIFGLHQSFYTLIQQSANEEITEKNKKKMYINEKINRKMVNKEYAEIINEENKLYRNFCDKTLAYNELNEQYENCLGKVDKNKLNLIVEKYGPKENIAELDKSLLIANVLKNKDYNGFKELFDDLKKDSFYLESEEIQKKITTAFFEYVDAFIDFNLHYEKEQKLYSIKYLEKMNSLADEGFFLYCLNTPDWPIDDDNVTINDLCDFLLDENCLYLYGVIATYVENGNFGEIYQREAYDLKAAFSLLIQKHYWASLRSMYSLIEHHHKLCAEAFNGYYNVKKEFKNGKQRSETIGKLFEGLSKRYEEIWCKIDKAIKEINCSDGKKFVSRNDIVHGDYQKIEVNPNAVDVLKTILIYVTLRQMVEHLKIIEEIVKNVNLYYIGYLSNIENSV